MAGRYIFMCIVLLITFTPLVASARYSQQIVDARLVALADRDVLVLRGDDAIPAISSYKRDFDEGALSVTLRHVGFIADVVPANSTSLVSHITMDDLNVIGVTITVYMADASLLDPAHFRFSQPSRGVLMLEVFPSLEMLADAGLPVNPNVVAPVTAKVTPEPGIATIDADSVAFNPDALGIATVDLSGAEPERVLGLAAATGLLDVASEALVATEGMGELRVKPAGQSLVSWGGDTPFGELYLLGTPEEIADFLRLADADYLARQPTIEQFWQANQPQRRRSPTMGGGASVASTPRVKDDPAAGLYLRDMAAQSQVLSDVRVTLPAMDGVNVIDVLNYLSLISGISLVIDPYAFEEPFGGTRPPKVPDDPDNSGGGTGFRPAGAYDPQSFGSGTVIGNLNNVPFSTALNLICDLHGLEYIVYSSGGSSSGSRYGSPASSGDSYEKPVVLITSRERREQELAGQNEIDLYQMHYADPNQVTDILGNLSMLPGTGTGWYIYRGSGGGAGSGSGGGSSGGGYGGGGGSSGGGVFSTPMHNDGLYVYRGTTRTPVETAVASAVAEGASILRVVLRPEDSGMYVTGFAH